MLPAIQPGDWLDREFRRRRPPGRQTGLAVVVVFREPISEALAIKRVGAGPGERVRFADGYLTLADDEAWLTADAERGGGACRRLRAAHRFGAIRAGPGRPPRRAGALPVRTAAPRRPNSAPGPGHADGMTIDERPAPRGSRSLGRERHAVPARRPAVPHDRDDRGRAGARGPAAHAACRPCRTGGAACRGGPRRAQRASSRSSSRAAAPASTARSPPSRSCARRCGPVGCRGGSVSAARPSRCRRSRARSRTGSAVTAGSSSGSATRAARGRRIGRSSWRAPRARRSRC